MNAASLGVIEEEVSEEQQSRAVKSRSCKPLQELCPFSWAVTRKDVDRTCEKRPLTVKKVWVSVGDEDWQRRVQFGFSQPEDSLKSSVLDDSNFRVESMAHQSGVCSSSNTSCWWVKTWQSSNRWHPEPLRLQPAGRFLSLVQIQTVFYLYLCREKSEFSNTLHQLVSMSFSSREQVLLLVQFIPGTRLEGNTCKVSLGCEWWCAAAFRYSEVLRLSHVSASTRLQNLCSRFVFKRSVGQASCFDFTAPTEHTLTGSGLRQAAAHWGTTFNHVSPLTLIETLFWAPWLAV